jgi:hypothetical protein
LQKNNPKLTEVEFQFRIKHQNRSSTSQEADGEFKRSVGSFSPTESTSPGRDTSLTSNTIIASKDRFNATSVRIRQENLKSKEVLKAYLKEINALSISTLADQKISHQEETVMESSRMDPLQSPVAFSSSAEQSGPASMGLERRGTIARYSGMIAQEAHESYSNDDGKESMVTEIDGFEGGLELPDREKRKRRLRKEGM